jgi:hypothetical protein
MDWFGMPIRSEFDTLVLVSHRAVAAAIALRLCAWHSLAAPALPS